MLLETNQKLKFNLNRDIGFKLEKYEKEFLQPNDQHFIKDKNVLLALSAGVDSIALFHILLKIKDKLSFNLGIAHVNHGFREESELEAEFAKKLADEHNLSLHFKKLSNLPKGENKSAWARKVRYAFLKDVRISHKYDLILTAHHEDDQIETFFLKLFANKEIKGVRRYDPDTHIFRPLLEVQKSELKEFVNANNYKFMQDNSNFSNYLIRNRIRNKLLPFIYSNFSDTTPNLLASSISKVFSDRDSLEKIVYLERKALEYLEFGSKEWFRSFKEIVVSLEESDSHKGISWLLVEQELKTKLRYNIGRRHANRFINFMLASDIAIELPGNVRVKRSKGGLVFEGVN